MGEDDVVLLLLQKLCMRRVLYPKSHVPPNCLLDILCGGDRLSLATR